MTQAAHSESLIQAQLFARIKAASANYPAFELIWWYPVGLGFETHTDPSGRRYSPKALKARAMGLKKDLPDIHILVPRQRWAGAFLELKAPGQKPRKEQKQMLERLKEEGYLTYWTDSLEDAWIWICEYLQVPRNCYQMNLTPQKSWDEVGQR